ncbi:hypothetical protein ACJIZ3_020922 [Penstemon smallii]|uniref:High-affinity nitrate transporter n=1 Tax=Penstemon smallii TaxID=265156 RepID=A0ABD3SKU9_9LAMI
MKLKGFLVASLLLSCLAATSQSITFSSLPRTIIVSASTTQQQVLKAGKDEIIVTWSLNTTLQDGTDMTYKTVKIKLCYAPISQKDRGWRKTVDNLAKDKTCQHKIVSKPYSPSNNTFTWTIKKDVPTATYFVRAYAYNSADEEVAFGQTAGSINLFEIQAISGRHFEFLTSRHMTPNQRGQYNPTCQEDFQLQFNYRVLKGGESTLTISWSLNATSSAGIDTSDYRTVEIKFCYAPISQKDRGWRKTVDELEKDKTCQHKIVERPYSPSNNTYTATIKKDVPSATYFVRLYVHNSHKEVVAFGDTTDAKKTTNLFEVVAVSGRSIGLDVASVCFSAFSIISLFGFFILEKRRAKNK